jgi:two-component system chemotaxis response regulator CheB
MSQRETKVLIIDDSAYNRQTLAQMLENQPGIRVVARAGDGDEGLRQVFQHQPDVITLDLEMPKMDGFTFLRILMSKRPTPVLVVSSQARKDNIFKALELGALDFIAKPTQRISPELREIERDLNAKVRMVSQLRVVSLAERLLPRTTGRHAAAAAAVASAEPTPRPRASGRKYILRSSHTSRSPPSSGATPPPPSTRPSISVTT